MKLVYALIACCLAVLTGCGQGSISKDADYFEGLDPSVVAEVLANPVAMQKIEQEPVDTHESLAQGGVRNFIVCRDALRVYQEWLRTGIQPTLAPLPMPDHPREPSHSLWKQDYARLVDLVRSGDPEQLRTRWLTGNGSCGQWIPAKPGDVSGPTIEDVVEGSS